MAENKLKDMQGAEAPEQLGEDLEATKVLEPTSEPEVAPEDWVDESIEVYERAPEDYVDLSGVDQMATEPPVEPYPEEDAAAAGATVAMPEVNVHVEAPAAQVIKDDAEHSRNLRRVVVVAIVVAVIATIAAVVAFVGLAGASSTAADLAATKAEQAARDEQHASDLASLQAGVDEINAEHKHDWTIVMKTINHDEVGHVVEHPAVYEDVTTYHSVCNECGELIDGHAAQHIAETGHSGYSRNVPLTETVLKTPAWSETVVDSEAWVENVADHMVCTECGATQELSKDMASQ